MATRDGAAAEVQAATTEIDAKAESAKPAPGPGKILIWSVHFPASDPDNPDDPDQPAPTVTASVTLDDQDGAVVHAKAASVIDYQSGAISRGGAVQVRYESPEEESSDNPVWVFDLVDAAESDTT
jgi:hypothetical protein